MGYSKKDMMLSRFFKWIFLSVKKHLKLTSGKEVKLSRRENMEEFDRKLRQEARSLEEQYLADANLSDERKKELSDRLKDMIMYAIGRHDWYDEQRLRFLTVGLALLAAFAALATVLTSLSDNLLILTSVIGWVGILCGFATGIALLYLYNSGVERDHPYRYIADIRSWYFIYGLRGKLPTAISKRDGIARKQKQQILNAYKNNMKRWYDCASEPNGFLKEDLQQVFILHVLQRYRYQDVKRMSKTLFYGMLITLIVFLLAIASSFLPNSAFKEGTSWEAPRGVNQVLKEKSDSLNIKMNPVDRSNALRQMDNSVSYTTPSKGDKGISHTIHEKSQKEGAHQ